MSRASPTELLLIGAGLLCGLLALALVPELPWHRPPTWRLAAAGASTAAWWTLWIVGGAFDDVELDA